jgi:hypothetical protein
LVILKKNLVSFFSARIAKQEDEEQLRLIEEEEKREQERKRRKMALRSIIADYLCYMSSLAITIRLETGTQAMFKQDQHIAGNADGQVGCS